MYGIQVIHEYTCKRRKARSACKDTFHTSPHHTTSLILYDRQQSVPLPELGSTAAPLPAAVRAALRLCSRRRSILLRGIYETARQRHWPKRIPLCLDVRTSVMTMNLLLSPLWFMNSTLDRWMQCADVSQCPSSVQLIDSKTFLATGSNSMLHNYTIALRT